MRHKYNIKKTIASVKKRALEDEWRTIDRARALLERPIISEMELIFDEQLAEAEDRLQVLANQRATILTIDFIFDLAKWVRDTFERLFPYIWDAIENGYGAGSAQMGEDLPDLTSTDPLVRHTLEVLTSKTKHISQTTQSTLSATVDRALREGWSINRVTDEIRSDFQGMKAHRPKTIAQTSVTAGFSAGQDASYKRAGVEKRWLSQRDGQVRDTHDKADGQTVGPNDKFKVGLALLRFPGDPESERLEEIINCRCALLPGKKINS